MDANTYQQLALRTVNPTLTRSGRLAMAGLGLAGESGEVADMLKKVLYHGRDISAIRFADELGDLLWYLAILASTLNIKLEDIMEHNIDKLGLRHPNGFQATYPSDSGLSELQGETPHAE